MKQKAKILIIDDEESIRLGFSSILQSKGYYCAEAETGAQGLSIIRSDVPDLILLDMNLPDMDGVDVLREIKRENEFVVVIMATAFGTIEKAVQALKLGAENFLTKPIDSQALLILIEHCLKIHSLRREDFLKEFSKKGEDDHFVGSSSRMLKFYELVRLVSKDSITVLITGETGTGKGKWAQWIHKQSDRSGNAFVEVNCAGLSKELLESELFGYEQGAFTGAAKSKAGLIEIASGGTLFLDEISEMELSVQAKVLKVLEEKKFRRLGSVQERHADIRLVTATNRDLQEMVKEAKFREDLFYRLNIMPLELPPLRERKEEIVPVAEFFLAQMSQQKGQRPPVLTEEAKTALKSYSWPGNLREMRNVLERAFLLAQNKPITSEFLPTQKRLVASSSDEISGTMVPLRDIEIRYIKQVLARVNNNYRKAAEILGVNRNTIYNRLREK
ncbi:sigma-54 dependent transcriptional regulator [bacterium]|nr:sigma-54 dependent transcriptional regulator [bacterium]MCI0601638.1 sigma-54 dependent transcriptional regulator [bacterium]